MVRGDRIAQSEPAPGNGKHDNQSRGNTHWPSVSKPGRAHPGESDATPEERVKPPIFGGCRPDGCTGS